MGDRWYRLGGILVPSVTTVTSWAGYGPSYGGIPPAVLAKAAARGTRLHEYAAFRLRHPEAPLPELEFPEDEPYRESFEWWCQLMRPKAILIEQRVSSEIHGYSGTMDLLAELEAIGAMRWLDYKTREPHPFDGVQIDAYKQAGMENWKKLSVLGVDGNRASRAGRMGVTLRSDGKVAKQKIYDSPLDFERFKDALRRFRVAKPEPMEGAQIL